MNKRKAAIFCTLIITIPTFYLFRILNGIDKYILGYSLITEVMILIGILAKKNNIMRICQFMYVFNLFIILLYGRSVYILTLAFFVLLLTIITRIIYNACILSYKEEYLPSFIPSFIKEFIQELNWDFIYSVLLIIVIFRIYSKL